MVSQVHKVGLLAVSCEPTLFAYIQLGAPLLVGILLVNTMDFLQMGLKRATLSEGLVTQAAFVGAHTRMCSDMSFEVEGIIEAFAAEVAEVPFDVIVALQVPVQHALKGEGLLAYVASERIPWAISSLYRHLGMQVGCNFTVGLGDTFSIILWSM